MITGNYFSQPSGGYNAGPIDKEKLALISVLYTKQGAEIDLDREVLQASFEAMCNYGLEDIDEIKTFILENISLAKRQMIQNDNNACVDKDEQIFEALGSLFRTYIFFIAEVNKLR